MKRDYHRWFSPSLGRDMELLVFGHAGARLLAFPTSRGPFYEWEQNGLIGALWEHLERGWLQIYCVDSVDGESWYAYHKWPGDRAWRQLQYDQYISAEVLPLSRQLNANPFLITAGASFGAFHALSYGLRHPDLVNRVISMSGLCDIRRFLGGYYDTNVYFLNPCDFLANESDPHRLAALRRQDVILVVGRDDALLETNERLSAVLWSRGIGNALRVWNGWHHDWPHWHKMMRMYVGGHD
jgi:esterase/lipase superfamily enzyme